MKEGKPSPPGLPPKSADIFARTIIDPRVGDVEDDVSSTKAHRMTALAGSILVDISLARFLMAWGLLVFIPGILLGLAPLVLTAWLSRVTNVALTLSGLGWFVGLTLLAAVGLYGLRPFLRQVESSFWSLQALAVQPVYAFFRESLSQSAENFLALDANPVLRMHRRSVTAVVAGLLACALGAVLALLVWPHTRWVGTLADLITPLRLATPALANTVAISSIYLAAASLVWGLADASMPQPEVCESFDPKPDTDTQKSWHIAHLSDLHMVGEPYGFRLESGRSGPQGNARIDRAFQALNTLDARDPLDTILITGDMTDAGRSAEWIEFLRVLSNFPRLAERVLILPGNHDVNVVDRANPARLELPTSPMKQLRKLRTLSAMAAIQGKRVRIYDRKNKSLGRTLSEAVEPYRDLVETIAGQNRLYASSELSRLWVDCFPQVVPPQTNNGLGILILNSNADSNFSFTNALGLVPWEEMKIARAVIDDYPDAGWIVALHHHLMEYPMPVTSLSVRVGTALINGSWVVRQLQPVAKRVVVMHGHRHIDWRGRAGHMRIISAPSPVMEAKDSSETTFRSQKFAIMPQGSLAHVEDLKILVPGQRDGLVGEPQKS